MVVSDLLFTRLQKEDWGENGLDFSCLSKRPWGDHRSLFFVPISQLTVDSLYHKSTHALREIWTDVVGPIPRCPGAREFLLLGIAWHLQAQQSGGLASAVQRRLKALQKKVRTNDLTHAQNTPSRFQPGTVLVKEWQGRRYTVMVQDRGFAYNGTTYQSLSAIARLITGTRWNGPVFFGVRQSSQKKK